MLAVQCSTARVLQPSPTWQQVLTNLISAASPLPPGVRWWMGTRNKQHAVSSADGQLNNALLNRNQCEPFVRTGLDGVSLTWDLDMTHHWHEWGVNKRESNRKGCCAPPRQCSHCTRPDTGYTKPTARALQHKQCRSCTPPGLQQPVPFFQVRGFLDCHHKAGRIVSWETVQHIKVRLKYDHNTQKHFVFILF